MAGEVRGSCGGGNAYVRQLSIPFGGILNLYLPSYLGPAKRLVASHTTADDDLDTSVDFQILQKECISYLKLVFKVSNNGAWDDATDATSINAKDGDNAAGRDGRSIVLCGGRRDCLAVSHF
nr:hypothetical protein Iba_chr11bCG18040 [Ipomoea batatas]